MVLRSRRTGSHSIRSNFFELILLRSAMRLRRIIPAQVRFVRRKSRGGIARPPGLLHNMLYTGTAMIAQRFEFHRGSSAVGMAREHPLDEGGRRRRRQIATLGRRISE